MKSSTWISLISLIVALLAGYLLYEQLQSSVKMVEVPVLTTRVSPGTKITPNLVGSILVDEKIFSSTNMPVVRSKEQIVGKIAYTHILENTMIFAPQLVEDTRYLFDESKQNYFVVFNLSDLGNARLPYNFIKGKINICVVSNMALQQIVDPKVLNTLDLQEMICPVRYIPAVALTNDNVLPWTYMVYDQTAQKYVPGPEASKIGFWVKDEQELDALMDVLYRPRVAGQQASLLFVLPPFEATDNQTVIEKPFIITPTGLLPSLPVEVYPSPSQPQSAPAVESTPESVAPAQP